MGNEQDSDTPTPSTRISRPLTPEQRERKQVQFLKAYRESGNIKHSCKVAGINRSTFYDWRDHDEAFKAQLPDATEDAHDTLEFAAYERAVKGVESFVLSMGRMVYEEIPMLDEEGNPKLDKHGGQIMLHGKPLVERKYSDSLLTTLLKANMPEKYKDRVIQEHTGKDGGPIKVERTDYSKLTDDELAFLEQLAQKVNSGDS